MKAFRIAALEFKSKAWLLGLAFAVGLLAWATPLLKTHPGGNLAEARAAISGIYCLGTVVAVAILLGAGLLGPDLQEGRITFYLARPITPSQLLGGRLANAFVMTALCGFLVCLPTLATQGMGDFLQAIGPVAVLGMILILVGHVASVSLRALTTWLLLDATLLVLVPATAGWLAWRLFGVWAVDALGTFGMWALALLILALLVAAFAQISFGRTDLKRNHRVLSLGLAAGLSVAGLAGQAYVSSVLHVDASEIQKVWSVGGGEQGPWIQLSSFLRDGRKGDYVSVLFNTRTGRGHRLPREGASLSRDGRTAVWWAPALFNARGEGMLQKAELREGGLRTTFTGIAIEKKRFGGSTDGSLLALSPDGGRVAFLDGDALSVHDLDSGAQLAHQALPTKTGLWGEVFFLGPEHVRAYVREAEPHSGRIAIFNLDLQRNRIERTGEFKSHRVVPILNISPDGSLLIVRPDGGSGSAIELRDAGTGGLRNTLTTLEPGRASYATFLASGDIATLELVEGLALFKLLDQEGEERWRLPLPANPRPNAHSQLFCMVGIPDSPSTLPLQLVWHEAGERVVKQFSLDLNSRLLQRVNPDHSPRRIYRSPYLDRPPTPGSFLSTLRLTTEGTLLQVDSQGDRRVVAGRN